MRMQESTPQQESTLPATLSQQQLTPAMANTGQRCEVFCITFGWRTRADALQLRLTS